LAFAWMSFVLITILGIIGGIVFLLRKKVTLDMGNTGA